MALRRFVLLCAVAACAVAEEAKPEGATGENGEKKEEKSKQEIVAQYSYCQEDNCYELLGVSKESKAPAIKRAYRKLAAIWHPDKNPDPRAKELFPKYANAYEVLFNPEMRSNYDYLLAHPQEFPGFFMRYYKPTYMPKSDVRLVTVLTMIFLSTIQYLFKKSTYENQLGAMKRDPKYKDRLKQLMNETSTTPDAKKQLKGFRGDAGTTKGKKVTPKAEALEELKAQAEAKLDGQLQQEGKIPSPPLLADTLAVAFFKVGPPPAAPPSLPVRRASQATRRARQPHSRRPPSPAPLAPSPIPAAPPPIPNRCSPHLPCASAAADVDVRDLLPRRVVRQPHAPRQGLLRRREELPHPPRPGLHGGGVEHIRRRRGRRPPRPRAVGERQPGRVGRGDRRGEQGCEQEQQGDPRGAAEEEGHRRRRRPHARVGSAKVCGKRPAPRSCARAHAPSRDATTRPPCRAGGCGGVAEDAAPCPADVTRSQATRESAFAPNIPACSSRVLSASKPHREAFELRERFANVWRCPLSRAVRGAVRARSNFNLSSSSNPKSKSLRHASELAGQQPCFTS